MEILPDGSIQTNSANVLNYEGGNEIINFLGAKTLLHIFVSPAPSTVGEQEMFNCNDGGKTYKTLNHTKQSALVDFSLNIISYLQSQTVTKPKNLYRHRYRIPL